MTTLLCFGDSNTHGTAPMHSIDDRRRFGPDTRWPVRAAEKLDWTLIEEGLPGRTAAFPDPVMGAHMDGTEGLKIALESHIPIDWLTIMLGTNDAKARFGASPERILGGIACLLDIAQDSERQARHGGFRILLIAPPPVIEVGAIRDQFWGARARGLELGPMIGALAAARGCAFLDSGKVIEASPVDGVHFEAEAHLALGAAVAEVLAAA